MVGATARITRFACAATNPTHKPYRPEGALERREAPPPPPPSTFIARTRCHHPELRRPRVITFAEPDSPLRLAEAAPATPTDDMASDPVNPTGADSIYLYFLSVIVLDVGSQEFIYVYSKYPSRSATSDRG